MTACFFVLRIAQFSDQRYTLSQMDIHLLLNPIVTRNADAYPTRSHPPLHLTTNFQPFYPTQIYRSPNTANSAYSHDSARSLPYIRPALACTTITSPFEVRMKKRSQLSKDVLDFLKNQFSKNKFPDTDERARLSILLNVPAKSIQSNNFI